MIYDDDHRHDDDDDDMMGFGGAIALKSVAWPRPPLDTIGPLQTINAKPTTNGTSSQHSILGD